MERSKQIVRTSIIGIIVNVVLVLFKAAVGFFSNSIAIVLDAVNNLSDALSSVITIVGTRLAGKRPDKKHPFGHGRIEYLASVLIAVIVLLAGVVSLKESIEKIIRPETAEYSVVSLIIIAVAVVVKLLIGSYFRRVGTQVNSGALTASGSDAFFDAALSFATLIAGVICLIWGFSLEGWLGVVISIAILKAGFEILQDSLSAIIGHRADPDLSRQLRERITSFPTVRGAYDLTLHNYGPTQIIGSVHIAVPDDLSAKEIHRLTRQIAATVYQEFGIALTVGIYASNDPSPERNALYARVEQLVSAEDGVLQMHGFYVDEAQSLVMFDLIVSFEANGAAIRNRLISTLGNEYPQYHFDIVLDTDLSD